MIGSSIPKREHMEDDLFIERTTGDVINQLRIGMVVGFNRTSYTGVGVGTILCSLWLLVPVATIPYNVPAFCVTHDAAL